MGMNMGAMVMMGMAARNAFSAMNSTSKLSTSFTKRRSAAPAKSADTGDKAPAKKTGLHLDAAGTW